MKNLFMRGRLAYEKSEEILPVLICKHSSLIMRRLGNVDLTLQENKAVNLQIAAPKVSKILIKPNETFSFWKLVGNCSAKKGYKEGLTISGGKVSSGTGGGMCQFTNLIHWLVLHTPMEITEHHHHDGIDLFPDYGRQIPFGVGTSIMYNYLDYRFFNNTGATFQLITYTSEGHLHGEIRADRPLDRKFHIKCEDEHFVKENDTVYRKSKIYKECYDKSTGNLLSRELIKDNFARVMYDTSNLTIACN